jgi:hypothetical protein
MEQKWVFLDEIHVKNCSNKRMKKTLVGRQLQYSCKHNQMQKVVEEITNDSHK